MKGPDHPSHYPGQEHKLTEHNTDHDMAARSAHLRLLGPSHATGGEAGPNLNTAAEDEGVAPNPDSGNAAPEGRRMERNGIHLRKKAVFATWNIRGANTAKLQVITNEMTRLNIKILGIADNWMLGQGRFTMQEGNVMLYTGKESGPRREGVGFILDKEATKSIIGYNPM